VRLTLGRYAHAALHDLTAAVDALPDLLPAEAEREAMAATGTGPARKLKKGKTPLAQTLARTR
jgi:hypothetical protein